MILHFDTTENNEAEKINISILDFNRSTELRQSKMGVLDVIALLIFLVVFVSGPAEAVFAPASLAELKIAVVACTDETPDGTCPVYGATNGPIGDWDISRVTSLHSLFSHKSAFNQDLSKWNTSKVSSMYNTFYYAESFNQDLSKWDVSRVTSMYNMFHHGLKYNQPMENWDVSRVTNMGTMFYKAAINQVSQKFAIEATKAN